MRAVYGEIVCSLAYTWESCHLNLIKQHEYHPRFVRLGSTLRGRSGVRCHDPQGRKCRGPGEDKKLRKWERPAEKGL